MVAFIHSGLDNLAIRLAGKTHHQSLKWVAPPQVDPEIPLGERLMEPDRLAVVWPRDEAILEISAPTRFLEPPNDRMRIRFWPTSSARKGSVILVPPWKLVTFAQLMPVVRVLQRMGFDVVGYPTPYHFERTPDGSFSGEYFATWDMPRTGWAIRTAALELCALTESLSARGPVTLAGLSLGGYLSSMASVVAPLYPARRFQMDRLCLLVPPESILDTFQKTKVGDRYRELLVQAGGQIPDATYLQHLSLPFSPCRFRSCVPGERIFVAAGRHDGIVPIESSRRLAQGLGARFREYEAGHLSGLLLTYGVWRDAARFIQDTERSASSSAAAQDSTNHTRSG